MDQLTSLLPMDNQFFTGGLTISILLGVWQFWRQLVPMAIAFVKRRVLCTITVDSAYHGGSLAAVYRWLEQNGYGGKVSQLYYDPHHEAYTPASVYLWIRYDIYRLLLVVSHTTEQTQHGTNTRTVVSFTGRRAARDAVTRLVEDIKQLNREVVPGQTKIEIASSYSGFGFSKASRSRDSIYLAGDTYQQFYLDIHRFLSTKESYYQRLGIPWRRSYLLQGPPGTGKTSVAQVLAGEFHRGLMVINNLGNFGSTQLLAKFYEAASNSQFVLIEDIDALGIDSITTQDNEPQVHSADAIAPTKKAHGVSLAEMLNCLDGVGTPEGLILLMTTNYPERINSRLRRPGRIDYVVDFDYMDGHSARRMAEAFYPDNWRLGWLAEQLSQQMDLTPAQLQMWLQQCDGEVPKLSELASYSETEAVAS